VGGLIKGLILSVGVWLGIIGTPIDPALDIDIWRSEEVVLIDAVVENAESAALDRVLMSGNPLLLTLTIDEGRTIQLVHRLVYDPARRFFTFTDEKEESRIFGEPFVALLHFFSFRRIPVFSVDRFSGENSVELQIRADIAVENLEEADPNWLWGYHPLLRRFHFHGEQEIPF